MFNKSGAVHGIFLAALLAFPSGLDAQSGGGEQTRIVILHDNDIHFNLNFSEQVRAVVRDVRDTHPNTLLLNAGDFFVRHEHIWPEEGGAEFYREKSESVIRYMNELGYDAGTLGNHDLDAKGETTGNALRLATFPLLGANLDVSRSPLPEPLPYITLTTGDGVSIAVVGLSVINFEPALVTASDPIEAFGAYAHLRENHDVLIALTHLGIRDEIDLAHAYPELDVVIGGHTNSLLPIGLHIREVLVAQTGGHNHAPDPDRPMQLGEVVLIVEDGRVVERCAFVYAIDDEGARPVDGVVGDRPIGAGTCGRPGR